MLEFLNVIYILFSEMSFYLIIGLSLVSIFHIFFSKEFVVRHVGQENYLSSVKAALFGVPLPICSCGVIPTAIFMAKNGASKGAVISFLISTPQTGIDSIVATYGMLGPFFAIFRPFAAFFMGITGGIIVTLFSDAEKINNDSSQCSDNSCSGDSCAPKSIKEKKRPTIRQALHYAFIEFLDDISIHFLAGLLIAGLIAFFMPDNLLVEYHLNNGVAAMVLMIILGAPMYVCATSSIPIAITLMLKGVSPGAAFVFLTAGPVTNAASLTVLIKVIGKKTTLLYLATIAVTSILLGLSFDYFLELADIDVTAMLSSISHHHKGVSNSIIYHISAIILGILLAITILKRFRIRGEKQMSDLNLTVNNMSCNHCASNVKNSVEKLNMLEMPLKLL